MSKADVIEVEGVVVEKLPNAFFKVELEIKLLLKCPHTIFQKEESSGEINKNYLKKSLTSLISTCYNAIRTLLNSAFLCVQKGAFEKKGGFAVKVRSSVKPICENAK